MSSNMSRRTALTQGGLGLLAASGLLGTQRPCTAEPQQRGEFTLPPLPYAVDAMESTTTSTTRLMSQT